MTCPYCNAPVTSAHTCNRAQPAKRPSALNGRDNRPREYRPLVEHGRWQCSGCSRLFIGEWQRICPCCKRNDYWSGSVSPNATLWADTTTKGDA